jgi:hypothetical protein
LHTFPAQACALLPVACLCPSLMAPIALCRPLYMTPIDAIEYGLIDKIVKSEKEGAITGKVMSASQYDKQAGLVTRQ